MAYTAKAAVRSEIRKKTLNAKRAPFRIFEFQSLMVRKETARLTLLILKWNAFQIKWEDNNNTFYASLENI